MSYAPCLINHPDQPNRLPDDNQILGAFLFHVCFLLTTLNLRLS
ncbi:hypothetical protein [Vibrio diabolicus]|nr:hypothetical protein [Vibrio diabolicus]